jgi:exodeoxyribonuclease VII small subunit
MSDNKSYSQLNQSLEAVISKLQSSDLDVDEVISEYQKGIDLVKKLENYLKTAQNKVVKLTKKDIK